MLAAPHRGFASDPVTLIRFETPLYVLPPQGQLTSQKERLSSSSASVTTKVPSRDL